MSFVLNDLKVQGIWLETYAEGKNPALRHTQGPSVVCGPSTAS